LPQICLTTTRGGIERVQLGHERRADYDEDKELSVTGLNGIELRLQVNNVTDEPLRIFRDNQANRIGRYDEYGRRYLFDVTLKF
jgi:iron complex outermembrane receptor protein